MLIVMGMFTVLMMGAAFGAGVGLIARVRPEELGGSSRGHCRSTRPPTHTHNRVHATSNHLRICLSRVYAGTVALTLANALAQPTRP